MEDTRIKDKATIGETSHNTTPIKAIGAIKVRTIGIREMVAAMEIKDKTTGETIRIKVAIGIIQIKGIIGVIRIREGIGIILTKAVIGVILELKELIGVVTRTKEEIGVAIRTKGMLGEPLLETATPVGATKPLNRTIGGHPTNGDHNSTRYYLFDD